MKYILRERYHEITGVDSGGLYYFLFGDIICRIQSDEKAYHSKVKSEHF